MLVKQSYIPENISSTDIVKELDMPFLNYIEKNGKITVKEWFEDIQMIGFGAVERLLFFDTETSHMNGYACSIGVILTDLDGNMLEKKYMEINPGVKIDPEAIAVHGITNEQVANAPVFKDIKSALEDIFSKTDLVLAYNAMYDIGVLIREYQRLGVKIPDYMMYHMDLMPMISLVAQTYDKNGKKKKNAKLGEAAEIFGIVTDESALHNALYDTEILTQVFFKAKDYGN